MSNLGVSFRSILLRGVRSEYFIAVCLIASLVVRISWVCIVVPEPLSDFEWYYQRGVDISEGKGYSVNGVPTAFWPMGYPAFLGSLFSVFGPSLLAAKLSNIILYMGILYLSYFVAKTLFASEFCGRATLAILAFYPNHIAYSSLLSTEILFLFLLLLGTALLMKARQGLALTLASGVVFGLACLIKPQILLIPSILLASLLMTSIERRKMRRYVVLLMVMNTGLALTILPWMARNYCVFGAFTLSNNAGLNLLYGNNPYANGTYSMGFEGKLEPLLDYTTDERERDIKARSYAMSYILEHPVRTVSLWPRKLFYLYNEDGEGFMWNEKGIESPDDTTRDFFKYLIRLDQVYYVLVLVASLVSVFVLFDAQRKGKRGFPKIPLIIIAYFTFTYLLTFAHSRLHFPLIPWMAMYAGALIEIWLIPRPMNET